MAKLKDCLIGITALGLTGVVPILIWQAIKEHESAADIIETYSNVTLPEGNYRVIDNGVLSLTESEETSLTFDFNQELIMRRTINNVQTDGITYYIADAEEHSTQFDQYESPQSIENARNAGCFLYNNLQENRGTLEQEPGWGRTYTQDNIAKVEYFGQHYC